MGVTKREIAASILQEARVLARSHKSKSRMRTRARTKRAVSRRRSRSQRRSASASPPGGKRSFRVIVKHALRSRLLLLVCAYVLGRTVAAHVRDNPALLQWLEKRVTDKMWSEDTQVMLRQDWAGYRRYWLNMMNAGPIPDLTWEYADVIASVVRTLTTVLSYVTVRAYIMKSYEQGNGKGSSTRTSTTTKTRTHTRTKI